MKNTSSSSNSLYSSGIATNDENSNNINSNKNCIYCKNYSICRKCGLKNICNCLNNSFNDCRFKCSNCDKDEDKKDKHKKNKYQNRCDYYNNSVIKINCKNISKQKKLS